MTSIDKMSKLYCLPIWLFFFSVSSILCQKVAINVYYETLDLYCSRFFTEKLNKFSGCVLFEVADLRIVPWGRAVIQDNNTFVCENGPDECFLNMIEACAVNVWPPMKYDGFLNCVQHLVNQGASAKWEKCFGCRDRKPVDDCYRNGLGKELELKYAEETNSLQPPLTLLPWVTVDGKPLYDDYNNYISHICNAYKGPPSPACNGSSARCALYSPVSCR